MNVIPTTTDNVTDILLKIVEFTQLREEILAANIERCREDGFVPMDLDTGGFADTMAHAISEHVRHGRLVLRDGLHVRFFENGHFEFTAVRDEAGTTLLRTNRRAYLDLQMRKISENLLNRRIAKALLKQVQVDVIG